MPTEFEYERAAAEFRSLARILDDQAAWAPVAPSAGFVSSASIAAVVDDAQAATIGFVVRAADELRRIAGICDHRAGVCRAHARAMRLFWATPAEIRLHLEPPAPPAPWVET